MVQKIKTYEELEEILQEVSATRLVVLDCFATWCGPCKSIAPFLKELASTYTDVLFLKGDVEKIEKLTTEFKVRAMPTFIFFKDMKVIGKVEGASQRKLVDFIEENK